MESQREAANTYNLIITRRNASEFLLLPRDSALELPRVAIRPRQRIAEQLIDEVARNWGVESHCLLIRRVPKSGPAKDLNFAVLESVQRNDDAPPGTCWAPRNAAGSVEASEAAMIRQTLEEIDNYAASNKAGPFARPGWLRELFLWADKRLAPFGLRLSGGFRQLNASPTFSLIRLETNAGAVWFKATGKPNRHELPITLALAELFPRFLPQIIGIHRAWNGWLSPDVPGISLDEACDFRAWEGAAETLAELQVASIGRTGELLRARAKDLRTETLLERIHPFHRRMAELMARQENSTPAPLTDSELKTLEESLNEACATLRSLGLPGTVGHQDFNPGNIRISGDRCVILDWAEAAVTHPFVTFEYLAEHLVRSPLQVNGREKLVRAYLGPWASLYPAEVLRRALELSPLVAVFTYAVAGDIWRSPDLIRDSILAGSFRSLTRRMYRESVRAAMGSEPCLG